MLQRFLKDKKSGSTRPRSDPSTSLSNQWVFNGESEESALENLDLFQLPSSQEVKSQESSSYPTAPPLESNPNVDLYPGIKSYEVSGFLKIRYPEPCVAAQLALAIKRMSSVFCGNPIYRPLLDILALHLLENNSKNVLNDKKTERRMIFEGGTIISFLSDNSTMGDLRVDYHGPLEVVISSGVVNISWALKIIPTEIPGIPIEVAKGSSLEKALRIMKVNYYTSGKQKVLKL